MRVALREFVHGEGHGRSHYALYVDRQLVGVLDAKPDRTTLTEVERQTYKYIEGVPDAIPAPVTLLPFGYEATGTESRFTCFSDPEPRSRRMFGGHIHRPETCRSCGSFDSCRGGCMAAKFAPRVMVTIGRRPPLRGCDEDPLAGFVTR
jgi:hypothetical protein